MSVLDEEFWNEMWIYSYYYMKDTAEYAELIRGQLIAESGGDINNLARLSKLCANFHTNTSYNIVILANVVANSKLCEHLLKYKYGIVGRKLGGMVRSLARMYEIFQTFQTFRGLLRGRPFIVEYMEPPPVQELCVNGVGLDNILRDLDMSLD